MNCCCFIILLLLLGSCGNGRNDGHQHHCSHHHNHSCDNDCVDTTSNCTRTQTVITRTECDSNSYQTNMASDSYGNNRYSMYHMDNDDCGCQK